MLASYKKAYQHLLIEPLQIYLIHSSTGSQLQTGINKLANIRNLLENVKNYQKTGDKFVAISPTEQCDIATTISALPFNPPEQLQIIIYIIKEDYLLQMSITILIIMQ